MKASLFKIKNWKVNLLKFQRSKKLNNNTFDLKLTFGSGTERWRIVDFPLDEKLQ